LSHSHTASNFGSYINTAKQRCIVYAASRWLDKHRRVFWVLLPLCHFWRKSAKKCDRESADRQTDRNTHRQSQTEFIMCPMLYAIAVRQIIKIKNTANQTKHSAPYKQACIGVLQIVI